MSATPAGIAAAIDRLRATGALLRRRSREDVVETLGLVLEGFRDPESHARKLLESELPPATGFTPEVVRAGLEVALEGWKVEALRALVASELAAPGVRFVTGFDTTAVLLGGALPPPTLLALLAPLLLRSAVLAKTSQHDPVTARIFARALADLDPDLGACLEVVSFSGSDAAATDALLAADCVVATGSDETVASLAARVRPPRRFVGYGHRISVAVLRPAGLGGAALARTAQALALDVALWDQLGCLSPVSAFVVGDADAVAEAVAVELAALATRLPRGNIPPAAAAAIAHERGEAEMRAAAGHAVRLHGDAGDAWTVIRESDARLRPCPLHRFLRVQPLRSAEDLLAALRPLGPHLAGVALAGFGDLAQDVSAALLDLGASRVCAPGRLQAPPLSWHHDGLPVLLPLARFGDVED